MRRALIVVLGAGVLAGCMMEPEMADGSFEMSGNYQAIADCSFLIVRRDGASMWNKVDLSSQNRAMITYGVDDSTVGRIDFIGIGRSRTKVEPHMGNRLYVERYKKQFAACAG